MTTTAAPAIAADGTPVPAGDIDILRGLAGRLAAAAAAPDNRERRDAWYRHDAGDGARPMILAETGGVRDRARAVTDADLRCGHAWARGVEHGLRVRLYQHEVLRDDHVIEPRLCVRWQVKASDYGVEVVQHRPEFDGLGARRWDAPITDLERDLPRLRPRTFGVDREGTWAEVERLRTAVGDLLDVTIRGNHWWTLGMTWTAIELIGLEHLMLAMYDEPDGLHALMAFLRDDAVAFAAWLEAEGLLCLNNEDDYIGSGSMGYTRSLPAAGHDGIVRTADQWVLLESQETVGVGPEQFAEFIFPYQRDIAERFGRVYYGCCEPVHTRIHVLRQLPGLERISVSPWADQEAMAAALGDRVVFSRKPNPTLVSTEVWDEAAILDDLAQTLRAASGCRVELIMKDVHTLCEQPWRLPRWVELARRAIDDGVHDGAGTAGASTPVAPDGP